MKAYRFRLKNNNIGQLNKMASAVNFVWNYCNQSSKEYIDKRGIWLTKYDLQSLTSGCSKYLDLHSGSIQAISHEFVRRRIQFKKSKLSWRSKKRSLGWVPFSMNAIKINDDTVRFGKNVYRFWKSREIEGKIKGGSFSQDSKGNWYVNIVCDVPKITRVIDNRSVGIDLGLKTIAVLSDGNTINRNNITNTYADKLATAHRANKKKQVKSIHAKIKNVRKDFNHKETTKLINNYGAIYVGDVSSSKLIKTRMAKSVSDAGWFNFKSMLKYKAIALGVEYKEVKENFSTITCSVCFERTGPRGLSMLGVREWTCKCGTTHNRDVNAAKNILRFGHESLIKRNLNREDADLLTPGINTN